MVVRPNSGPRGLGSPSIYSRHFWDFLDQPVTHIPNRPRGDVSCLGSMQMGDTQPGEQRLASAAHLRSAIGEYV